MVPHEQLAVEVDEGVHHGHEEVGLELLHRREVLLILHVEEDTQDLLERPHEDANENAIVHCFEEVLRALINDVGLKPLVLVGQL